MDISVIAVLIICGLYGFWRWYDQRRSRSRHELVRSRIAWMLWTASQRVTSEVEPSITSHLSLPARR